MSQNQQQQQQQYIPSNYGSILPVQRDIQLPCTFVVLQGTPGDGLANTVDSMPLLPESSFGNTDSSLTQDVECECDGQEEQKEGMIGDISSDSAENTVMVGQSDVNSGISDFVIVDRNCPEEVISQTQGANELNGNSRNDDNFSHLPLTDEEKTAVIDWEVECRTRERQEMNDLLEQDREVRRRQGTERRDPAILTSNSLRTDATLQNNENTLFLSEGTPVRAAACDNLETNPAMEHLSPLNLTSNSFYSNLSSRKPHCRSWWQRSGRLCVFSTPYVVPGTKSNENSTTIDDNDTQACFVVGTLSPGQVVMVTNIISVSLIEDGIPNSDYFTSTSSSPPAPSSEKITRDFLQISSPMKGFVLYQRGKYVHLLPGLPTKYVAGGNMWMWRSVNRDGAFVRSGLELNSFHCTSVPHGGFVRVIRKTINAVGLSRLKVKLNLESERMSIRSGRRSDTHDTTDFFKTDKDGQLGFVHNTSNHENDFNTGWISEMLNPLSGQRGSIVKALPFPVPMLFQVTLEAGAVIRSDVELSSPEIRTAPKGSLLRVVGRSFSEHPIDKCIVRLQLAGGGGYVSEHLNLDPPADIPIVKLIGMDKDFDVDMPGMYHIRVQNEEVLRRRLDKNRVDSTSDASESELDSIPDHLSPTSSLSHQSTDEQSGSDSNSCSTTTARAVLLAGRAQEIFDGNLRDLVRKKKKMSIAKSRGKRCSHYEPKLAEEKCLICLSEDRTATIIHGGTGHIACCLACARILKARGDRCPVCRLPIDSIVQQFWA